MGICVQGDATGPSPSASSFPPLNHQTQPDGEGARCGISPECGAFRDEIEMVVVITGADTCEKGRPLDGSLSPREVGRRRDRPWD